MNGPDTVLPLYVTRLLKRERDNKQTDHGQRDSKRQLLCKNSSEQQRKYDWIYLPVNDQGGTKSTRPPLRLQRGGGRDQKKYYKNEVRLSFVQITQRQRQNK